MICTSCAAERKGDKLGAGWHRLKEETLCRTCWGRRYVMRAVTIPVASLAGQQESARHPVVPITWEELRPLLKEQQAAATRLANWLVRQLAQDDVCRLPGQDKLPPMPRVYRYPAAREVAPELATGTTAAMLHAVESRYVSRRYHVVWLQQEALPTYRYPAPLPVRQMDMRVLVDPEQDGRVLVNLTLGQRRVIFRLAGGGGHRSSLALLREVASGTLLAGEAALLEQPAQHADHRPRGSSRVGMRKRATRLAIKVCVWRPKAEVQGLDPNLALVVKSSPDAFLIHGLAGDEHQQVLHEDQLLRWIVRHRKMLDRTYDDHRQHPKRRRPTIVDARLDRIELHKRRLKTHAQQIAALLVQQAVRRHAGRIETVLGDTGYVPSYPWYQLQERISQLCQERGLQVAHGALADVD